MDKGQAEISRQRKPTFMKRLNFCIPIYDWDVTIVRLEGLEDETEKVESLLKQVDADPIASAEELKLIRENAKNGGDTWREENLRKLLVILFPCDTWERLFEVVNHEKRHMVDRIMQHCLIKDTEAAAYLDGFISVRMWEIIKDAYETYNNRHGTTEGGSEF